MTGRKDEISGKETVEQHGYNRGYGERYTLDPNAE